MGFDTDKFMKDFFNSKKESENFKTGMEAFLFLSHLIIRINGKNFYKKLAEKTVGDYDKPTVLLKSNN